MITYDYLCNACNDRFELLRSIRDESPVSCPRCASGAVERVFTQAPVLLGARSGKADSPLGAVSNADSMQRAADRTVNKVLKDMGRG